MARPNKRNLRHEQKAIRRNKEIARQRDALEKKEDLGKIFRNSVAETALVGAGKLEVTDDNRFITFTDENGISVKHEIDHIEIVEQNSEDWKTYVGTGGDSNIPEGSVAVKITTNWEKDAPPFNQANQANSNYDDKRRCRGMERLGKRQSASDGVSTF